LCITLHFSNHTATPELATLSLHDALPIFRGGDHLQRVQHRGFGGVQALDQVVGPVLVHQEADRTQLHAVDRPAEGAVAMQGVQQDRKSTRLNSSHVKISYAVFCLKKKKTT